MFIRESLIAGFVTWFKDPANFHQVYAGLVTPEVLSFWDQEFFEGKLFIVDEGDISGSRERIGTLLVNNKDSRWLDFNQATSRGAPRAILGRNNYLRFLKEIENGNVAAGELRKTAPPSLSLDVKEFHENSGLAGLEFQRDLVVRFFSSLASKQFVILTGLSGSGKSKLAEAFATWICEESRQYCLLPVGADWTNREPLLGFPNALVSDDYVVPENGALRLLLDADYDKTRPFFLILDEMNLSHVERYFADFLSVMESGHRISLHAGPTPRNEIPLDVEFPTNLFIIGTVNIDETTYMFSPKVLDRANVIEFRVNEEEMEQFLRSTRPLDLSKLIGKGAGMAADFLATARDKTIVADEETAKAVDEALLLFFDELRKVGAEFGYRTASEIKRFAAIAKKLDPDWSTDEIVDAAIMQKLLPKVHGSRRKLEDVLQTLCGLCLKKEADVKTFLGEKFADDPDMELARYPMSALKVRRMYHNLMSNGFTSYAEA